MAQEKSGPSLLGIGLILIGIIAGFVMWEQCDPDWGRKWLSDECYDDYYQNSAGECCKIYPVGATVAFLFFAIPGFLVVASSAGPAVGTGNVSGNTYNLEQFSPKTGPATRRILKKRAEQKGKKEITKTNDDSLVSELKKLNELKEQGILDEDEFKSAKRKLIEK